MITNKNYTHYDMNTISNHVNEYKKQINKMIDNNVFNPPIITETVNINGKNIIVVQDGHLISGTKQRVVLPFLKEILKDKNVTTLLYKGSINGYGPVATALACKALNLQAKIFLMTTPIGSNVALTKLEILNMKQIHLLLALNAQITLCDKYRKCKQQLYHELDNNDGHMLIPMGLNDTDGIMHNILTQQLTIAIKDSIIDNNTKKRIWLVAGSGGILMALYNLFKNATFFVFLTGGGTYYDNLVQFIEKHPKIHLLNETLVKSGKKYYKTVINYDDQIIPYVEKYGKEGDIIWNVATDQT